MTTATTTTMNFSAAKKAAAPSIVSPSMKKINLKNSDGQILVDAHVFEWLQNDERLKSLNLIENLRLHSSSCAVFQKTRKVVKGQYATETIYLHKLIAEKFLPKTDSKAMLAGMISENKLDCRLENLIWRDRATASRLRKTTGKSGYIGVYQESRRFRAVISHNGRAIHIGMYDTAREAAGAYNKYSKELYGAEAKLNKL